MADLAKYVFTKKDNNAKNSVFGLKDFCISSTGLCRFYFETFCRSQGVISLIATPTKNVIVVLRTTVKLGELWGTLKFV